MADAEQNQQQNNMDNEQTNQALTNVNENSESKVDINSKPENMDKALPVRRYLDTTVVPLLLTGLQELVKERPNDPIEWLAHYLLKNNPNKQQN
mmetsp:Transcript_35085/g.43324  ORF Transcript_35085/g.43324 Transcript_35085/m.43324 type:complete len:94 (-) Transcript_35085:178-459(-)|eukprot:CAMPEP_0114659660 /NCGR_PEP_ID=MMETSP0191-20121206/18289_1 /TAXON_ID=126664 /ORGANISM="Sorites sp." /LENGTH=93 /DNA_ID=CAMNT_0001885543 /DNA_START=64 /DNA_END=345 /DNA_ORIENTATION=+